MAGVDVHVTVPEERVRELLGFAASLWESPKTSAETAASTVIPPMAPTVPTTMEEKVREAYEGGQSKRWRPFLVFFAQQPGQWVKMADGFEAVGFKTPQGIGMVGAAERRCKARGFLPYEKRWSTEGKAEVRISAEVAREILRLAGE